MDAVPTIHFSAGAVIFRENDHPDGIYFIVKGQVKIVQTVESQRMELAMHGPDTIFGEMALVDNCNRSAAAIAVKDTYCYRLKPEDFKRKLVRVGGLARNVLSDLALTVRVQNKAREPIPLWLENRTVNKSLLQRNDIVNDIELQAEISELDPFMSSIYRILMKMAFG